MQPMHDVSSVSALLNLATCCWCCISANAEPSGPQADSDASIASDQYTSSPKRQYLIAPRIGRGAVPANTPSAIWSALEEASFLQNGQVQPQKAFPGPLRSSLLFLVGNRRLIGPRSTGLLPQARIGRRAAPMGLLPQPRVGRRSYAETHEATRAIDNDGDNDPNGQQEVAMAALSDSTLVDAIESMMEG